jgi:hypothetical protein
MPRIRQNSVDADIPCHASDTSVVSRNDQIAAQIQRFDSLSYEANERSTGESAKRLFREACGADAGWNHTQEMHGKS